MHAEIISIGDELTSGQRLDTNSQWLSQRLGELGVFVRFHTTVADDLASNVAVFRIACDRADVVVVTGGLGPTADDLTREALSQLVGRPLVLDETSLTHIRALFARRQRPMPERNVVQATFPAGSQVIPNPHGTAPGIALNVPRTGGGACHVYALPGVPAEMFEMWEQTVAPQIAALRGQPGVIRHRAIRCFGVGESDLEAMLPDLIRRGRTPSVGITASEAIITLRITAQGETPAACDEAMESTVATIHECLGQLVYGEAEDELADAVLRLLIARGNRLATVEWGSAGMLALAMRGAVDSAARLGNAAAMAAERAFVGGIVVATAEGAARQLRIDGNALASAGSTSRTTAELLAEGGRGVFDADWVLAAAAYPNSDGQADEIPRAWFAASDRSTTYVYGAPFSGHPALLKPRAAKQALNLLRLRLLNEQS